MLVCNVRHEADDMCALTWCSDDLLLSGDAAARQYGDMQSAMSQRRLQQQQQQQAAEMYLDTLQQQQQASMARSGAGGHPGYLQQEGMQTASGEAGQGAYQRAPDQYSGALQQQSQHFGAGGASESAAGFRGDLLSDGLSDLRQAGGGGHLGQGGGGGYDPDQIMQIARQDLSGYSGRWQDDDGGADNQYQLATAGARPSLTEVDWYDPRVAEQQLLAHRQQHQQPQQMLPGGYDYGAVSVEPSAGVDAMPYQTTGWMSGL